MAPGSISNGGLRDISNGGLRSAAADWSDFDAWLVDLDGTLYRQAPVRLLMAAELLLLGPHRIRAIRYFRKEQERLRGEVAGELAASGEIPSPYQTQLSRAAAGLGCTAEALAPIVREWMERRPGKWLRWFRRQSLLAEISAFRARGGKTALVSDYPAQAKLAGLGASGLFDLVVASGEPGGPPELKPSPAGYLLAAERLQISSVRCLVIGDRDDADGLAARRAGMAFRKVR
jgi:HAD superfamily hydrolase (TIGR01549 family)